MSLAVYYQRIRYETFQTIKRFPLAILCSLAFCFVAINNGQAISPIPLMILRTLTWTMSTGAESQILDLFIYLRIFFCGACWFVALQLFWEEQGYRQGLSYITAIPVFFMISIYIQMHLWPAYNVGVLEIGLFLLTFCAPVLRNGRTDLQFWLFGYRLWIRIGYSFFAALILFLGVMAILSCLDYLFSFKFYKDQYKDLSIVVFSLFFPVLIFFGIEKSFKEEPTEQSVRPIYYLLEYLIVPLIFIYSLILYAYMIKITVMQSLPRGGIVYLASSYGCVGILAHLISIPQGIAKGRLVSFFRHHFFKILIFPAILLAIAINYRIQQYGLTEARYMVVLCLIFFSLSILFSFSIRREFFAKVTYTILPCLFLISSMGPWSINSLPMREQIYTLQKILETNGVMKQGRLVEGKYALSEEDKFRISGILDYLSLNNRISYLKPWFEEKKGNQLFNKQQYVKAADVAAAMGIDYKVRGRNNDIMSFSYGLGNPDHVTLKGYDYYIPNVLLYNEEERSIKLPEVHQQLTFSLNNATGVLSIKKNTKKILNVLIAEIILALGTEQNEDILRKKLTIPFVSEETTGILMIQRIMGDSNKETKKVEIHRLEFSLLISK